MRLGDVARKNAARKRAIHGRGRYLYRVGRQSAVKAGTPDATLRAALATLERQGVRVVAVSGFRQTRAWPDPADPPFTNAIAQIDTSLEPSALLRLMHQVEAEFGRERSRPNAPRSLDLDLIDYRGRIEQGEIMLPHPRMAERRFVLEPLAEIAPGWRHPVSGKTVEALLAGLS